MRLILSVLSLTLVCTGATAQISKYLPKSPRDGHWPRSPFATSSVPATEGRTPAPLHGEVILEKDLLYDQYTLDDEYEYRGKARKFQWERIKVFLNAIDGFNGKDIKWAVLENYKNNNGRPPLTAEYQRNDHDMVTDRYGVIRNQSVPVYRPDDRSVPERYGRDGTLVEIVGSEDTLYRIENINYGGSWLVPQRYVRPLDTREYHDVIFVDVTNQNISVLQKSGGKWLIRSMNPCTTGQDRPPYQYETPVGVFVLQEKKVKMFYLHDGSTEMAGYAPYANRFTNGAYIHGVPTADPYGAMHEYSYSLGTVPRSHMCVRTATSHSKFIYDTSPVDKTLIIVIVID